MSLSPFPSCLSVLSALLPFLPFTPCHAAQNPLHIRLIQGPCMYYVSPPTPNRAGLSGSQNPGLPHSAEGEGDSALPSGLDPVKCGVVGSWLAMRAMSMSPPSPSRFLTPGHVVIPFGVPGTRAAGTWFISRIIINRYLPAHCSRGVYLSASRDMCVLDA